MKQKLSILVFIGLISCSNQSTLKSQEQTGNSFNTGETLYAWTKLLDSAAWKKSYNFQMFGINDTLWTFHHDGTWFSLNGVNWTKSSLTNAINNLAFLDYVQFRNAIYGLGYFEGNIERYSFRSAIYRTTDFKQWELLSKESNLPDRFFYHPFVFDNKFWIIGGEDKTTKYSDIWNSADGIAWTKQKENLPFGKRSGSQVVFLNGKLFLLDNDVWSSTDGLKWEEVTDEIVSGEKIFGYAAVVLDNKIWLLGCNRNGVFSSQVLVSADGRSWQKQNAPWTPRGGIAATVYKNKIYITGGKYGGTPDEPDFQYSNDVWMLAKKDN